MKVENPDSKKTKNKKVSRRILAGAIIAAGLLVFLAPVSAAGGLPSGETHFGSVTVEPAYNDMTGSIIYILTPDHTADPVSSNQSAWAPLYLVMYPTGSSVGTLDCMGVPGNCPDHDGLAENASAMLMPSVYSNGVVGHDHLLAPPASGGDFNIAWHVYIVLFTSAGVVTHITTVGEITAMQGLGQVVVDPTPLVFICAVVHANVYNHGTPVGS